LATTLGETGGDAVSMSMHLGYAIGSAIFIGVFVVAVAAQMTAKSFHPFLYWAVIIATTTAGTTMADFADRSLGIGYAGGSSILFGLLMMSLGVWYWSAGSVSVDTIASPKVETFYWATILFSQTLGTALGDWMADKTGMGLGYEGGALVFAASFALVAAGYFYTNISPHTAVLERVHPHAPARCDGGRSARQAARKWRARIEPLLRLGDSRGGHRRWPAVLSTKGRHASRRAPEDLMNWRH
jgi:uncharacterized membrane-anchored protein